MSETGRVEVGRRQVIAFRAAARAADPTAGALQDHPPGAAALAAALRAPCTRAPWERCGSHHSPPKVWRVAALDGTHVFGPPRGRQAFVLAEPGDGAPDPALAAELVRRYLRWHGPSTPQELVGRAGISPAQARRMWGLVAAELAEVDRAGERAWLLARDVAALRAAPPPPDVMLLAPGDPLLTARDRGTLAPDEALRRALFRPAGSAVLVDGEARGTSRARRSGSTLLETDVEDVRPEHAAHVAAVRGARRVEIAPPGADR